MGITIHESIFVLPNFLTTKVLWRKKKKKTWIKKENIIYTAVTSRLRLRSYSSFLSPDSLISLQPYCEMQRFVSYSIIETDDVT